jgi:hypothetical protein
LIISKDEACFKPNKSTWQKICDFFGGFLGWENVFEKLGVIFYLIFS